MAFFRFPYTSFNQVNLDWIMKTLKKLEPAATMVEDAAAALEEAQQLCQQNGVNANEVAKPGEIPVWRQPTGAQDAYGKGDKVHYPDADGPVYESITDGNVWEPGVYGWEVVT